MNVSFYQGPTLGQRTVLTTEQTPNVVRSNEGGFYTVLGYVVDTGLLSVLACLGIITNSLNLAVFVKQGYKESFNISMTYIAFWDLTKCLTGLLQRLYWPIRLVSVPIAESWQEILLPISIYVSLFSGYVCCVITTYVSIERCLCVVCPFSVKDIFTHKFTLIIATSISMFVFGAFIIMFFMYEIVYQYDRFGDVVSVQLLYNDFYKSHMKIVRTYYKVAAAVLPISSFVVLVSSSSITMVHLRRSNLLFTELRTTQAGDTGTRTSQTMRSRPGLPQRDKHATRTLLAVVVTYTVCMFPRIFAVDIPSLIETEYYALMKYHNIFMAVCSFMFVLDFSNASMNFLIFYKLSTNYRNAFCLVCSGCGRKRLVTRRLDSTSTK